MRGVFHGQLPTRVTAVFHIGAGPFTQRRLCGHCSFILTLVSKRNNDLFGTKTEDERGVAISTEGTYGTSEWMDKEEAKQVYEVCPVEDAGGTILGQFTQDGEEIVALPYKKRANRNLILIGPPGSGKSFGYVRTAIFQSVKREESIVITDPKG